MERDHAKTVQDPPMYDVETFCQAHSFGRAKLYELWAEGRGPARVKIGRRTLIPGEAAAAWRQSMRGQHDVIEPPFFLCGIVTAEVFTARVLAIFHNDEVERIQA